MNSDALRPRVLRAGLRVPVSQADGLDAPYWDGTQRGELWAQRCVHCATWQWGPEWICHACHRFDVGWSRIEPTSGRVYSWERVWHPVHPALADACPYVVVLVELPHAGGIRMVGNLVGDPGQAVAIGDAVTAVFEHHDGRPAATLVQWRRLE